MTLKFTHLAPRAGILLTLLLHINACTARSDLPPPKEMGDACLNDAECPEACFEDICAIYRTEGQSCDESDDCGGRLSCVSGTCSAPSSPFVCTDNSECTDVCIQGVCTTAQPQCGDGILDSDSGESCDDGNTTAGDGCDASCQTEPPFVAPVLVHGASSDRDPTIDTSDPGNWMAVWSSNLHSGSLAGVDFDIVFSRSTDKGLSWTAPTALSPSAGTDAGDDSRPKVVSDGAGNFVAVWVTTNNENDLPGFDDDLLVASSTDHGQTWTVPISLNSYAADDNRDDVTPQIATDSAGNWVAVWWASAAPVEPSLGNDFDIMFATSSDVGLTWSPSAALNTDATTDVGTDLNPQISQNNNGDWMAVWSSDNPRIGKVNTIRDIVFSISADRGHTWSLPAVVSDAQTAERADAPNVAADNAGNFMVVWYERPSSSGKPDIYFSNSGDLGATWSAQTRIDSNASTRAGTDSGPRVAANSADEWTVLWQSDDDFGGTTGSDYDIIIATSMNAGSTWSPARPLLASAATDSMSDGLSKLSVDSDGDWVVIRNSMDDFGGTVGTDLDIWVATSLAGSGAWSTQPSISKTSSGGIDAQPRIMVDSDGTWVATWASTDPLGATIGADFDILLATSNNLGATWSSPVAIADNAGSDSGDDRSVYVARGAGTWLAIWGTREISGGALGTDSDLLFATSSDRGTSWTAATPLNTNAAIDTGSDSGAACATDDAGNWIAVWQSTDRLSANLGSDSDILFATSVDQGAVWSAPAPLNANAVTGSGEDLYPQIATDRNGNWVTVWHSSTTLGDTIDTDWDIIVATSNNFGATWSAPVALNSSASTDSGDDERPQIAHDPNGGWVVTWYSEDSQADTVGTDPDILFARGDASGVAWTPPAAVNSRADSDTARDTMPQILIDSAGSWLVAWQVSRMHPNSLGGDSDVVFATSIDQGTTWTTLAPISDHAATDDRDDINVHIATNHAGHWVALWTIDGRVTSTAARSF